jgi:protein-tyrosine-phosphatase
LGRIAGSFPITLFGVRLEYEKSIEKEIMRILFVCTDNIGRSVTAEYCLKDYLAKHNIDGVDVASAGTHADSDMTGFSMAHFPKLMKLGIDASGHKRRQLSQELVDCADKIVVFDNSHQGWIRQKFGLNVPLYNEIYINESTEIRVSGPELKGTSDDRMIQLVDYIYSSTPTFWENLKLLSK